ncbi:hypothetical protein ACIBBG_00960 [Micromonospora chersina]|uniref:hypothetical protein n=1 Tax=Micromonospora chersina TaxID=47854 RepID=UPI0037971089
MSSQALAGALADERRRAVFAAIVLGAGDIPAVVSRTGCPPGTPPPRCAGSPTSAC